MRIKKLSHLDAALDEGLMESFPASDPVAVFFPGAVSLTLAAPLTKGSDGSHVPPVTVRGGDHESGLQQVRCNKRQKDNSVELTLLLNKKQANQFIRQMPLQKFSVGDLKNENIQKIYYDTPEFLLNRKGFSLCLLHSDSGWFQMLETARPFGEGPRAGRMWQCPVPGADSDFLALRSTVRHKQLAKPLRENLKLDVIFTTTVKRLTWYLKLAAGDEIELTLDRGSVKHGDVAEEICELKMVLRAGKPKNIFRCALGLLEVFPMAIEHLSKSARGYALCLPLQPVQAVAAGRIKLQKKITVGNGFKFIFGECIDQIEENRSALIRYSAPEGLHQMRIGLRRMATALTLFRRFAMLPGPIQEDLDWLSARLGEARDWEVLSGQTLNTIAESAQGGADFSQLRNAAADIAGKKIMGAISAVQSARFARLIVALSGWREGMLWRDEIGNSKADKLRAPLRNFADQCLSDDRRRLYRYGAVINGADPVSCHHARIAAKKACYAAEFFQFFYRKKNITGYLNALIILQDDLGVLNDVVVADQTLQELGGANEKLGAGIIFARGFLKSKSHRQADEIWRNFESMMCGIKPSRKWRK